jgi:hypothetical protein
MKVSVKTPVRSLGFGLASVKEMSEGWVGFKVAGRAGIDRVESGGLTNSVKV